MLLSRLDFEQTGSVVRPSHLLLPRLRITWSTTWRLVMSLLMISTFVIGMWAGIASQAAVAYAMSQQQAQLLHRKPPVSVAPRRVKHPQNSSIAACPALTGTPTVGGSGDDNGLGTLSFFTFIKQSLSDQVSLKVNVANGNLVVQSSDLTIHGTGLDLAITSTYNSQSTASTAHGNGWNLSVGNDVSLTQSGSNYILTSSDGASVTYEANSGSYGGFEEPPGIDATLLASAINGASHVIVFQHTGECLGFDSQGREIFDEDRNANQITFTYNGSNQMTTITDTQGRVTTFAYGPSGRVRTITDPIGRTITYGYDSNGNLHTITNLAGKVYTFDYTNTVLTSIADPDSHKTTIAYQSGNMVTSFTDATNATTSFVYHSGSSDECTSVNNSGDPCTLVTVTPTTTAYTTTYLYSGLEVQYVKDANGNMASTTYTPDANVTTYTDALLDKTVYTYDTGNTNNLMSATDANGAATSFTYGNSDPYLPTQETDPQGNSLSFSYNSHGNLTLVQDSSSEGTGTNVSYTYNSNGTLATSKDGDVHTTSYSYDAEGNLKTVTPPDPLGAISYTVDGVSRITSITDGKGQLTTFQYDTLDHITLITYNDGSTVTYTYDAEGNVTSLVDNTGTTTFKYDADNRITKKTLPGGQTITTAYDHVGNLTTFTDSGGTVTYSYTPVNLVASLTEPDGSQTTFQYDAANQRSEEDFPNGVKVDLDYDPAGHLIHVIATNSSNQTLIHMIYSYQIAGKSSYSNLLQTLSFQDPVNSANGTLTWKYSYDTMSRLVGAGLLNSNNQAVDSFTYSYDTAGNLIGSWEEKGNPSTTTYTYNAAEELTSSVAGSKTTNYSYDADGNLTGYTNGPTFTYNAKNQTTAIGTNSYTYTGTDQTERVQVNTASFEYSGLGLSARTNSSGTTYYTRCSCGMLVGERTPNGKYYYILDAQGSVVGVTNSIGTLAQAYVYDPYGNLYEQTNNAQPENPFRYASGYLDYTTGLYHFGARYYDPSLGRWTQQDPAPGTLGSPDSLNKYLYTIDDPINGVDPSGRDCAGVQGGYKLPNGTYLIFLNECTTQIIEGALWVGAGLLTIAAIISAVLTFGLGEVIFGIVAALFGTGAGTLQLIDALGGDQGIIVFLNSNGSLAGIGAQ